MDLRLQRRADVAYAEPHDALFARHAQGLLIENRRARDAIEDLQAGRDPARRIHAPIYRSRRAAVRNGLRGFLVVLISGFLFSLGGWPFASQGVALVGVLLALSATTPNPRAFAVAAVIATPIAALLAGATQFLILDGVDQFPLLAIGMAPSILAAALLFTIPNPRLASIGLLVLIVFPVLLSPTNPQSYDPETYLFTSFMAITAAILLFVLLVELSSRRPMRFGATGSWHRHKRRCATSWPAAGPGAWMTRPCSVTPTASGNWPHCSPPPTMNAVTTYARLSTSSDAQRLCDGSGQRSPNFRLARAAAWLATDILPWPPATPLACAAPPPISRAPQPSSIMMVRQQLARPA